MTEPSPSRKRSESTFKDYLSALGIVFAAFTVGIVWRALFGEVHDVAEPGPSDYRREWRTYILGLGLALLLTLAPFALVNWSEFSPLGLSGAIGAFAFVQVVVHFRCFMHIDPPRQNVDDLQLILFSTLLLLFMAGGTIWIVANLATRM